MVLIRLCSVVGRSITQQKLKTTGDRALDLARKYPDRIAPVSRTEITGESLEPLDGRMVSVAVWVDWSVTVLWVRSHRCGSDGGFLPHHISGKMTGESTVAQLLPTYAVRLEMFEAERQAPVMTPRVVGYQK